MKETLFGDPLAATDRPDAATVRALEAFGLKAEAVRRWSRARAFNELDGRRREEGIARLKAAAAAGEMDDGPKLSAATAEQKLLAAEALEESLHQGPHAVALAVSYAVFQLDDDWLRRMAGYLAKILRGQA